MTHAPELGRGPTRLRPVQRHVVHRAGPVRHHAFLGGRAHHRQRGILTLVQIDVLTTHGMGRVPIESFRISLVHRLVVVATRVESL